SPEFNSVCDSVYEDCLTLTQHALPGVKPYQLVSASERLHCSHTTLHFLLITKWVPQPLSRSQVDRTFKAITIRRSKNMPPAQVQKEEGEVVLGPVEFKEFARELFTNAVVSNAGKAVWKSVPIGVAGIAGVGAVTKSGKEVVGTVIGVYALGVATSIYLSLSG
ncbi:unnamed protein product, partial [Ilex paraguariensis]